MKKVTYVILFDIKAFDRKDAETIENSELEVFFASGCEFGATVPIRELVAKELEKEGKGILPLPISDFMEGFNNQKIDDDSYWMTYVHVNIETQADRDAENQDFKDFVNELDALCLQWGFPEMSEDQKRDAYAVYKDMQEQDPSGSHVWVEDALYSQYNDDDKMNKLNI